jgi:transposase
MIWVRMLAYITGTVDQELLLRNEYLAAENLILRAQIKGRLLFSDAEKATLAEIAHRLGRKALEELSAVAKPDTLLAWCRELIANKFDGSKFRKSRGRPRVDEETERLVVQMAKENPSWGYDRIVGALKNLGHQLSDQTVGNILRRHGFSPAPKRKQAISWKDSIRSLGESAGELGRNDALPGPWVDGTASTKRNHGGVGISERLPIPVA